MSYNPYAQQGYYQQPQQQSRQNIALKKSFGSGLYLFVAILNTLVLALAVVNIFMPAASLELLLQQLGPQLGLSSSDINDFLRTFGDLSILMRISNITACILPAISVLAMWLIWGNSKKDTLPVGTAGFTILKVLVILDLIGVCLIGIVVLIAMIPAIVGGSALDQVLDIEVSATVLIILLFVILIAALVLVIIYYAKLLGIYTAAKDVGRIGVTTAKVSMFVVVINFLSLIFQLVSIAGSLLTLNFLGAGSAFLGFLATLFVTIVFIKFRNALEEQKAATPPMQQPLNNPYQPYQSPAQQQYNNYNAQMQAQQAMQQQSQYAHPYPASQQPYGYQQNQYQQRPYQQPQQQAFQQYNNYNAQMQAQQQMQQQGQQTFQQQGFQPQQAFQQKPFQPQQQPVQTFQAQAETFQAQAAEVQPAVEATAEAAQNFASETVTPSDVIDE